MSYFLCSEHSSHTYEVTNQLQVSSSIIFNSLGDSPVNKDGTTMVWDIGNRKHA